MKLPLMEWQKQIGNNKSAELERQCSWCDKLEVNGTWINQAPKTRYITHGICPTCFTKQMEVLNG